MDSLALTEAQHRRRSYAAAYYPSPMAYAGVPSPPPPPGTTADAACETIQISPGINSTAAVTAAESAPPVPPCPHQPEPVEVAEIQSTPMHPPQPQPGVLTGDGDQFVGGGTIGNQQYRHPYQVRGRGRKNKGGGRGFRGGGRGFHHPAPSSSLSPPLVQAGELSAEPALVQEVAPATMATRAAAHLKTRLWCDTCRVECYSVENLEMHQNGKRHKKTLVKLEKYEAQQKLESGVQGPTPQIEAKIDAPVVTLTEAATPAEVPPSAPTSETNGQARHAGKRKKSPAFGPTRVCTLCNAMCSTEAIFEVHLGSKKHTARIKRLKGPGHVYGLVAAPIVVDQSTEKSAEVVEPLFFGLAHRDMVEPQVNGMGEEVSVQQQTVESGQVKDGAIEPQANQDVECSVKDGAIEPQVNQDQDVECSI